MYVGTFKCCVCGETKGQWQEQYITCQAKDVDFSAWKWRKPLPRVDRICWDCAKMLTELIDERIVYE